MEIWQKASLGDCVDLLSGGTPSKQKAEYWGGNIPWVSAKDMKQPRTYDTEDHVTEAGAESGTKLVPAGTTLLLVRGMRLAKELPITVAQRPVTFNQDVKAVTCKENVYPPFIFHLLRGQSYYILGLVDEAAHGTKRLQTDRLLSYEFGLPPLTVQKRLVEIFSAYDDLIENNARRVELLEEMAQAVYREWFVEMRFPGHADAEMRETEALGPVPAEWNVAEMSALLSRHMDTVKPYEEESETFSYFSFNAHDEGCLPLPEAGSEIKSNKHEVKPDAVLLSKLNPRIPRTWMAFPEGEHRPITSTEFMVLVPEPPLTQTYLYSFLSSPHFLRWFRSLASGTSTSHQRVSPRDFLAMPVAVPTEGVLKRFTEAVAPLLHQARTLRLKNRTLRHTRDLLLPRLVSGEVAVDDIEKTFA